MSRIDLDFIEGNDPDVTFALKKKDSAGVETAVDLTGATIELYIKSDVSKSDTDVTTIKYSSGGASPKITIQSPATGGKVDVKFSAADISGTARQDYHLDVLLNTRRQTYAYGRIRKADV